MEKKTTNEGIPKHMTPRERAEKEAGRLMCYDRYTQEGFTDFIERIINEAIKEEREASKLVGTVFGGIFAACGAVLIDKVGDVKRAVEIERKVCEEIADEIRKRELANYTGANYPSHTIAEEIRDKIRARVEKKDQSAR